MYKVQRDMAPDYLKSLFVPNSYTKCRNPRALSEPFPRIDLCKTSLPYSGSCIWNLITPEIRNKRSLSSFKANFRENLKTEVSKLNITCTCVKE